MKYISKILLAACCGGIGFSCVDDYEVNMRYVKPENVALYEYLNEYDVLSALVDRSANPDFKLGTTVAPDKYMEKEFDYSVACSNFDEVSVGKAMMQSSIIAADGTMDFNTVKSLVSIAASGERTLFGSALCGNTNMNAVWLNDLIKDVDDLGEPNNGKVVLDFEDDALGKTYPMTGNSTATIVKDPAADKNSGNVLQVGSAETPASYSFPKLTVNLPEGVTLGDCVSVYLDFNGTGSTGLYGGGMRISLEGISNEVTFGSPASFGCPNGSWGRQLIHYELSGLNLSDEAKSETSFTLIIGSGTGSGNYYMDNITINYTTYPDRETIIRTPEERAEILQDTLAYYIGNMMDACRETSSEESETGKLLVKAWDVLDEPMAEDGTLKSGENTGADLDAGIFYWQNYWDADKFCRIPVKLARQYGGDGLKLFINETGLDNNPAKLQGLIAQIAQWESDGQTNIDGIGVKLHLTCSLDPIQRDETMRRLADMFKTLGETGKLVRISELDIAVADAGGAVVPAGNLSLDQLKQVSAFWTSVVGQYNAGVPAEQRYGINLTALADNGNCIGLWDGNYNRRPAYAGFANGLAGKIISPESVPDDVTDK